MQQYSPTQTENHARSTVGRPDLYSPVTNIGMRVAACALLVLVSAGLLSSNAYAQKLYTCKDANGKVLTSDRPIPECAVTGMRELNPSGTTRSQIPGYMNAEQRAAKEAEDKRKEEAEAARQEQVRRDRALLASYRSVADIELAREKALEQPIQIIVGARENIDSARVTVREIEAAGSKSKKMTGLQRSQLEIAQSSIKRDTQIIELQREDIRKINDKYDQDVTRFNELIKRPAQTVGGASAPAPAAVKPNAITRSASGVAKK